MAKDQKMAKFKKQILVEKAKAPKANNLGQSEMFLTSESRQAFIELR